MVMETATQMAMGRVKPVPTGTAPGTSPSPAPAMATAAIPLSVRVAEPTSVHVGLSHVQDELELALKLMRPSLILVVSASRSIRRSARIMLQDWLELRGVRVERFSAARQGNDDVPLLLANKRKIEESVYFIERIGKGGDPAFRALNVRREYFVDHRVRAVFWLDEDEEKRIAELAPDFWAFRHLVVALE